MNQIMILILDDLIRDIIKLIKKKDKEYFIVLLILYLKDISISGNNMEKRNFIKLRKI